MIVKRSDIEEIEMDLTGVCNLSCYICTRNFVHSQHIVKKNIRPLDEIMKQVDSFVNLKRFFIAGVISEPTLYPEFMEFLKQLNSRGITYEIYTNGNTHSAEWWKKLGDIVPENCKVIFTVCGSTQELHEKYRVGSNLQQILSHASSFRKNGLRNDYVQHILFEYNKTDYIDGNMQKIFKQFSHSFQVHSEGVRMENEKVVKQPDGVLPPKDIDTKIKYIFKQILKLGTDINITCKLCSWKKIYIDQFGRLFPCYTYAEYGYPPLKDSDEFDLTDILQYKYKTCFLCSQKIENLISKFNLDFVC